MQYILALTIYQAIQERSFPGASRGKESTCNARDRFDPWVEKIPWKKKWQPTPVFLPGEIPKTEEPGGLQSRESQRVRHHRARRHTHACPKTQLVADPGEGD